MFDDDPDRLADLLRAGVFDQDEADAVFTGLVSAALRTRNPSCSAALLAAGEHYRLSLTVVRPLLSVVEADPDVLSIVASTHDADAEPLVREFLGHPDPAVRSAAQEALAELPGRVGFAGSPERYVTPAYARRWAAEIAPAAGSSLAELAALVAGPLRTLMPSDLLRWYRWVREVSLPDVANGYFVHAPDLVTAHALGAGVRRISGRHNDSVVVFGSDGGGTLYALRAPSGTAVYRLPAGLVLAGVYFNDHDPRYAVVAPSLVGFLDLLRDAVRHFTATGEISDL